MNVDEEWDETPSELALPASFIGRYERKNEPNLITTYMCLYVCGGGEEGVLSVWRNLQETAWADLMSPID